MLTIKCKDGATMRWVGTYQYETTGEGILIYSPGNSTTLCLKDVLTIHEMIPNQKVHINSLVYADESVLGGNQ